MNVELIGWTGTVVLSCCGIPQIVASFKDDIAVRGMTYGYLFGWIAGIAIMMLYIHLMPSKHYPYPLQVANFVSLSCALILTERKRRIKK